MTTIQSPRLLDFEDSFVTLQSKINAKQKLKQTERTAYDAAMKALEDADYNLDGGKSSGKITYIVPPKTGHERTTKRLIPKYEPKTKTPEKAKTFDDQLDHDFIPAPMVQPVTIQNSQTPMTTKVPSEKKRTWGEFFQQTAAYSLKATGSFLTASAASYLASTLAENQITGIAIATLVTAGLYFSKQVSKAEAIPGAIGVGLTMISNNYNLPTEEGTTMTALGVSLFALGRYFDKPANNNPPTSAEKPAPAVQVQNEAQAPSIFSDAEAEEGDA